MKRLFFIFGLVTAVVAGPQAARALSPDLVISEITTTGARIGVGELFEYQVTIRNIGGWVCTNGFRLVIQMPREIELIDNAEEERRFRPNSPFTCKDGTCRADPHYLFWPGRQLTTTVKARAKERSARGVSMVARAEADGCAEDNRSNNRGTSPRSVIFERPKLKAEFIGAQGLSEIPPRNDQSGITTVSVTNIGAGAAVDVALVETHPTTQYTGHYAVPVFLSAYKGAHASEAQYRSRPQIAGNCATPFVDGADTKRLCIFRVTLQPQDQLHVRYRWGGLCQPPGVPRPTYRTSIRATTADDTGEQDHTVSMSNAC